MNAMLSLYHSPNSRSSRLVWLLEELGADYQLVYCTILRGVGAGERDASNPHPDKRVPALVHDGVLITESAAIALYLTELIPDKQLGVAPGAPGRGPYLSWMAYYAAEVEPAFAAKASGLTEQDPIAAIAFDRVIRRVRSALSSNAFLTGGDFSAVDIFFSSIFRWNRALVPSCGELDLWLARLAERPAAKRALAKDAPPLGSLRMIR